MRVLIAIADNFYKGLSKGKAHLSENRLNTLLGLTKSAIRYGIYFIGSLTILPVFGINVSAILTAAGVGGLAIGFGAQNLVRDVIAGFFILIEGQFDVGDFVSITDKSGIVENIGLRTTTLKEFSGSRHIIPNGEIKLVTNSMGAKMRVLVELTFGLEEDLDYIKEVLNSLCIKASREIQFLEEVPTILGIHDIDSRGLIIRIKATAKPMKQWEAERNLRELLYRGLKEKGIIVSYPRIEVVSSGGERSQHE